MKTKFPLILFCALCALALGGCASGLITAAATKIEASAPTGEKLAITLPKEYDADKLSVTFNPVTKIFELKADKLTASSSAVVNSAARSQAEATGKALDLAKALGERPPAAR